MRLSWLRRPEVVLLTRPACPLCDEARAELEALSRRWRFRLRETDIAGDWAQYQKHREHVPVVLVNQVEISRGSVVAEALHEALQAAR